MERSGANNNPLLKKFNQYHQNKRKVPFQSNNLINQNVHVMNNLNNLIQEKRFPNRSPNVSKAKPNINQNIIEDLLAPQEIIKDNSDILEKFKDAETEQINIINRTNDVKITNVPYKIIIKDNVINKPMEEITPEDIIVHHVNRDVDADPSRFNNDLEQMKKKLETINDDLKIEFDISHYDKHKANFEYKANFIKNLRCKEKTFLENKEDYMSFYAKVQQDAEEGKKLCDEILHQFIDQDFLPKEENPF